MWLCSGNGERLGYKRSGFDPTVTIFFLLMETFSITSQNGSERLRTEIFKEICNASTRRCQDINQDRRYIGVHPCLSCLS